MPKRVTIPEAVELVGLSEYAIRKGIREGRYPHIRTGIGAGKILIDIDLLERYLEQEAISNTHDTSSGSGGLVFNYGKLRQVKA